MVDLLVEEEVLWDKDMMVHLEAEAEHAVEEVVEITVVMVEMAEKELFAILFYKKK